MAQLNVVKEVCDEADTVYSEATAKVYEKNRESSLFYRLERAFFDELIGSVHEKSILDVGCGAGTRIFSLLDAGAALAHGVELSQNMLDIARQNAADRTNVSFSQGDAAEIQNLGTRFDLVVSEFVFCYAPNRGVLIKMLQNCFNHLAPGGKFVATTSDPWQGNDYKEHNERQKLNHGVSYSGYDGHLIEAQTTTVEFTVSGQEVATATNYWYSSDLYLELMREIGFVDCRIVCATYCPKSMEPFQEQIQDLLDEPDYFFIVGSAPVQM